MASENEITITGNLAADPELRFIQNGTPVANFRVISSSRQFDRATNEWKDGASISIRVEAWNELAENVAETLTKGTRVIVRGRLSQHTYEGRDGVERTSVELRAEDVAVSLRWASAHVTRKRREGGQGGQGGFGAPVGAGRPPADSHPPAPGAQAPQGYGPPQQRGPAPGGYGWPGPGADYDPWVHQPLPGPGDEAPF